jgi:hypothetical protein
VYKPMFSIGFLYFLGGLFLFFLEFIGFVAGDSCERFCFW